MAFLLDKYDVMEHLWETLDKTSDGKHVVYMDVDIEQLWWTGFVDTEQFPMEQWKAAFDPYRQPDGAYFIDNKSFLALDHYRYKGEIRIPFDATKVNEGKYTDEGLDDLVQASIAPSTHLTSEKLKEFFDTLKGDFRQPDGLILIKSEAKGRIKNLIDQNPSPLRNLELLLHNMLESKSDDLGAEIDRAELDAAAMQSARQSSSFSATPTTKSESKAKDLQKLAKARKTTPEKEVDGKPKTELKKIKRSRKGMRG